MAEDFRVVKFTTPDLEEYGHDPEHFWYACGSCQSTGPDVQIIACKGCKMCFSCDLCGDCQKLWRPWCAPPQTKSVGKK